MRFSHEFGPDGGGAAAAGDLFALCVYQFVLAALVKAAPNAGGQVGTDADEPGVGVVVGGAGFARSGPRKAMGSYLTTRTRSSTALKRWTI